MRGLDFTGSGANSFLRQALNNAFSDELAQLPFRQLLRMGRQFGGRQSHEPGVDYNPYGPHRPRRPHCHEGLYSGHSRGEAPKYHGHSRMYRDQPLEYDRFGNLYPIGERRPCRPIPDHNQSKANIPVIEIGDSTGSKHRASFPIHSREAQVFRKAHDSIVQVSTSEGEGSGFFVTRDGLLGTNFHVINDADRNGVIVKTTDGKRYKADVVRVDPANDLAVLKVDGGPYKSFPALQLSDSRLDPGEGVMSIGHPGGSKEVVAAPGFYKSMIRYNPQDLPYSHPGENRARPFLDLTINTRAGISGAPLLDRNGTVVGISTRGTDTTGLAVQVELLKRMLGGIQQDRAPLYNQPQWAYTGRPRYRTYYPF